MHDNERLVRALDDAARTKDYEAIAPLLAPDVRAISPSYDLRSASELIEALRAQNDVAEDITTELTVDVVGDKVFWESIWRGTYPALGKRASSSAGFPWARFGTGALPTSASTGTTLLS